MEKIFLSCQQNVYVGKTGILTIGVGNKSLSAELQFILVIENTCTVPIIIHCIVRTLYSTLL